MNLFNKITIKDRDIINKYLIQDNNLSCEFSFGNSILWDADGVLTYTVYNDVLIYRMNYDRLIYCIPDFKKRTGEILKYIDEDAGKMEKEYMITCLSENMVKEIKEISDEYEFNMDRDKCDYIYDLDELRKLNGKKFHKKKNHLNKFLQSYEFAYEVINENNIAECLEMKNEWMNGRSRDESMETESRAIDRAFENYKAFDFCGGLIRIDGRVAAFTFGERLGSETFVTHFEKGMEEIDGIYVAINRQFSDYLYSRGYRYVNREDDLGLEGLRQAKLSYRPCTIYEKYTAVKICTQEQILK